MALMDHPNIVKAYAKELNDQLGPCIVMEYIDGMTLDQFLESDPGVQTRRKVVEQLMGEIYVFLYRFRPDLYIFMLKTR